jgi:hypothetical protein
VDPVGDDLELLSWLDRGYYGYVDPMSQFDFDDELEKALVKDPWPWSTLIGELFLAKWRPVTLDLWRRLKKNFR